MTTPEQVARIKDYSLFIDRNLVTERKLPEPWGLLLYLSWFQLDFNDYIKDKEE